MTGFRMEEPLSEIHLILQAYLPRPANHGPRQSLIGSIREQLLTLEACGGLIAEVQPFVEQILAIDQQLRASETDTDIAVQDVERLPLVKAALAVRHLDRAGVAVIRRGEQADPLSDRPLVGGRDRSGPLRNLAEARVRRLGEHPWIT